VKKQHWLEEWEADLVLRSLNYMKSRADEVATGDKMVAREKFCGQFTAAMIDRLISKFDTDTP
jgi:hypothetical protein